MAESKSPPAGLAAFQPLVLVFGGLFVAWALSILWLRQMPASDGWARQTFPMLLWLAAIALWIAWQRPARPAEWIGFLPLGLRPLGIAAIAFIAVFGWHAIRVALGRMPGGLLAELPAEIYAWLAAGIVLNEVLFRGILQTRLVELIDPRAAIIVAGLVGTLFRVPSFYMAGPGGVEPLMLVNILLLGLLAGVLRHVSRSLWPAIALAAGNALGTLL